MNGYVFGLGSQTCDGYLSCECWEPSSLLDLEGYGVFVATHD